jgi:hypothetical protein
MATSSSSNTILPTMPVTFVPVIAFQRAQNFRVDMSRFFFNINIIKQKARPR